VSSDEGDSVTGFDVNTGVTGLNIELVEETRLESLCR